MGSFWFNIVLMVHVFIGIAVVVFVLLQHGKGADMGASFGGGASGSLFGASGSANFLSRTTAVLATIFFMTSLGLTFLASQKNVPQTSRSLMDNVVEQSAPVTTQSAPADDSKSKDIPK